MESGPPVSGLYVGQCPVVEVRRVVLTAACSARKVWALLDLCQRPGQARYLSGILLRIAMSGFVECCS